MKYRVGDSIGSLLLTLCVFFFPKISPRGLVFIGRVLGTMGFYLIKKYRKRVIGNLSFAFGKEKDFKEIKTLAKESLCNSALIPIESIYMAVVPFDRFVKKIEIEGREHLDAALGRGKGVIALGAHFGSFTLLGMRLALEGYPFNLISDMGNSKKVMKRFYDFQKMHGQKPFPSKPPSSSIKKSLNSLRRNEILYLIADEQKRRGGIPVPFFGKPAYTPTGPAIFSLKTGALILPMFVLREKGIPKTLLIRNPVEMEYPFDGQKDIELLTAKFTKIIEDMVRQYPSQWTWLNRRWKLPYQKGSLDMGNQEV